MQTIRLAHLVLATSLAWPAGLAAQTPDVPTRLSLADAVRIAEARNPALAAAREQIAVANADVIAARQRPNPALSVASEGYRPGDPPGARVIDQQEFSVEVEQEFETAGRRRLRSRVAAAALAASTAGADDRVRILRLDVQTAYLQLVLARLDAAAADAALQEVDKVIALNRSRFQQGEISGGELRRLEVERLKFTDDALAADLATRNARSALLALLGSPRLDLPIEPTDGLTAPPSPTDLPRTAPTAASGASSLTGRALDLRADLRAARDEQMRARAELDLQRALRIPNVTVGAGFRRDFGTTGLVVGVAIPLPVFDRNAAGLARAAAEARVAAARLSERELTVSLEVQQALDLVEVTRQRVTYLEREYLGQARAARDAVLAAYQAGEGMLLDYLDAQRAHRDVLRAYNRALFDHRLSLHQLDAAVGTHSGGPRS